MVRTARRAYRTLRGLRQRHQPADPARPRAGADGFPGRITDRPLAAPREDTGRWVGGSVDQWVEELTGAVLAHGAPGSILFSAGGGTQDAMSLGRWANEIVPAVRKAIVG